MTSRRALKRAALEEAQVALTSDKSSGNSLGALGIWVLDDMFQMPTQQVHDSFRAAGLDPGVYLVDPVDHVRAFAKALEHIRATVRSQGYRFEDAQEGPNKERRITVLKVHKNNDADTTPVGRFVCPVDGTAPFVEVPDPAGGGKQVRDKALDLFDKYTDVELRACIANQFRRYAGLCAKDGVWFLPPGALDAVRKLRDILRTIGAGDIFLLEGFKSSEESVAFAAHVASKGLEDELKKFGEQAKKYTDAKDTTRDSTIAKRLKEGQDLRQKWNLYRALLGASLDSGDEKIAEVEHTLKSLVEA